MASRLRKLLRAIGIAQLYHAVFDVKAGEWSRLVASLPLRGCTLVRIGGDGDGGYLVPDDLEDVEYCFSPGVAESASFERDLLERYGIRSFLADASVEKPPSGVDYAGFQKIFIGERPRNPLFRTLKQWIDSCLPEAYDRPLILQMDIEGSEYEVLAATPIETLRRFRLILVEFHGMDGMSRRGNFSRFRAIMRKLSKEFAIVHVHPNNNVLPNEIGRIGHYEVPSMLEFTFLKLDRVTSEQPMRVPHPLDMPNVDYRPDLPLGPPWTKTA